MGEPWPRGWVLPASIRVGAMPPPAPPAPAAPGGVAAPALAAAATRGIAATPAATSVGQGAIAPTENAGVEAAEAEAGAALAMYARVLGASSWQSAAHALVGQLAHDSAAARVTLGLHRRGRMRVAASSGFDAQAGDERAELPQRLLGAMDEAIEQGLSLAWPPLHEAAGGASKDVAIDPAADPILHEHAALHRLCNAPVATVPLGIDGEPFGAVCLEAHAGQAFTPQQLRSIERRLALAVPALRWMQQGAEPWHRRLRRDWHQQRDALRRPDARGRRWLLGALAAALAFVALVPLERGVGGRARVEGAEQRVLAAPADGFIKTAHVRPGDRVKAGDALVDLVEADLRLERERWASQLAQHENAYAAAMARAERAAAATSLSRISEAQAQLALVDEQLLRGRVTAPFDALVIQGDLSQSIGMPVRQGDTLLTLAAVERYRVIVEVDETEIAHVHPGQGGSLALSSLGWGGEPLRVERIAPLARAVDGRNVFEVEARLPAPPPDLRPGLLGRAEIVVGREPPLWAWAGRALDRLRLAWWAWLG